MIHLTHDQTYAQALVDAGLMQEAEVRKSPLRHVLSGLVGCNPRQLSPEVSQFKLALHDKLLLCTDGLTSQLTDDAIADLLAADLSSEEACGLLVNAANDAGGQDNTTVVLAHFTDRNHECLRAMEETVGTNTSEGTPAAEHSLAAEVVVGV